MKRTVLAFLMTAACWAQESDRDIKQWRYSLIPVAVTSTADIWSSQGLIELNPIMGRGEFGARQTAAKIAGVGLLVGVEYLVIRKWPKSAKAFSIVNFGYSGVTAGVVVHNWRQR